MLAEKVQHLISALCVGESNANGEFTKDNLTIWFNGIDEVTDTLSNSLDGEGRGVEVELDDNNCLEFWWDWGHCKDGIHQFFRLEFLS